MVSLTAAQPLPVCSVGGTSSVFAGVLTVVCGYRRAAVNCGRYSGGTPKFSLSVWTYWCRPWRSALKTVLSEQISHSLIFQMLCLFILFIGVLHHVIYLENHVKIKMFSAHVCWVFPLIFSFHVFKWQLIYPSVHLFSIQLLHRVTWDQRSKTEHLLHASSVTANTLSLWWRIIQTHFTEKSKESK